MEVEDWKGILKFDARKHFYKVIDVWDWGWNKELWSVHPREVNKATLSVISLYPNKRFIIHYLQPHYPYLFYKKTIFASPIDRIKGFIRWKLHDLGLKRMADLMLGPPPSYLRKVAKKIGIEGLRMAYEFNLRLVLIYVKNLLRYLDGKIIITSDHGEDLGEQGIYGHCQSYVPWLVINKPEKEVLYKNRLKWKIKQVREKLKQVESG